MMTAAAVTTIIFFTVFITGVAAGVIGVITMAVHRTERNHALTLPAADPITQTGRWFHGVYVRAPVSARAPVPGRQSVHSARRATDGPKEIQPPPSGMDPASSTRQPRPGCHHDVLGGLIPRRQHQRTHARAAACGRRRRALNTKALQSRR